MSMQMSGPVLPWWRVRMVWLVAGGPAAVVIAGLVTLVVAVRGGDRPLLEGGAAAPADSRAPATQARNHAGAARP
ncbi:MAG: hypothetical protein ABIO45_00910 [Burkholderiaceae bacterium]